jgi:phosphonate transport system substrate-binding protein
MTLTTTFVQARRRLAHLAAACLGVVALGAAGPAAWAQTPTAAPSPAAAPPAAPANTFTIGVLPNVSARLILSSYQPMREYFERELKQRVEIATAPDFRSFAEQTLKGEYQMVVIAPNLGRVAQLDAQWEPLAIYEPRIPGVAVSLASNAENSPAQLKGKALALANPQSLVALVGLQWLRSQGLQAGTDFNTVVAANDDSLGAMLRSGETPWAIMSMGEFRAKPEALRQSLRIVHEFARLPGFYVMGNPKLPAATRQRLRSLMLQFPSTDDGKRFFGLSGFASIREITDADLKFVDPFNDITRRALNLRP